MLITKKSTTTSLLTKQRHSLTFNVFLQAEVPLRVLRNTCLFTQIYYVYDTAMTSCPSNFQGIYLNRYQFPVATLNIKRLLQRNKDKILMSLCLSFVSFNRVMLSGMQFALWPIVGSQHQNHLVHSYINTCISCLLPSTSLIAYQHVPLVLSNSTISTNKTLRSHSYLHVFSFCLQRTLSFVIIRAG